MALDEGKVAFQDEKKDDVLVLHLKGRLDAISSPFAERKIFDYIESGEHKIILDLKSVGYMSSAGMRVLLSVTKKLKTFSGKCIVVAVTPNVMDILKMSGFNHILELSATTEEALRKF